MKREEFHRDLEKAIEFIYFALQPGKSLQEFGAALRCAFERFGKISIFAIEVVHAEKSFGVMVRGMVKIVGKRRTYFAFLDRRKLFSERVRYLDPESGLIVERPIPDGEEAPAK